jgi:large subunit ribosomal protein L10
MANAEKTAAVAELADNFRESNAAVLTDYRGLTVKQLQELRRSLGENVSYAVAKNTLAKIAAKDAGVELDTELLIGPTAIAFIRGDAVEAAKSLRDFAKTNPPLVIKGGFLDGKILSVDEINKLADLESREVLLARLAGGLAAGLQQAASLFNAPLAQTARLVAALEAKVREETPAAAAAPAEEAAPAADDAQTTVDEAPAESTDTTSTPVEAAADTDVETTEG